MSNVAKKWMTEGEFEQFWEDQGFCYRFGEFHDMMRGSGLRLPFNNVASNAKIMLRDFLVNGDFRKKPTEHGGSRVMWWNKKHREEEEHYEGQLGSGETPGGESEGTA